MIREPLSIEGAQGFRYAELPEELLSRLPRWLEEHAVPEGEEIRPARLYRWSGLGIKFYGRKATQRFRDRLPGSPAVRSADLHARILPIRSPKPLLALDRRRAGKRRASLLVYEWVEGPLLGDAWDSSSAAARALPSFVARMHNAGIYHGDLHLQNVVWDGEDWNLIDLDGLRHRLRNLSPARLAEDHWSRVWFGLELHFRLEEREVRALFDAYLSESNVLKDAEASWKSIKKRFVTHRAGHARLVARRERERLDLGGDA